MLQGPFNVKNCRSYKEPLQLRICASYKLPNFKELTLLANPH